MYYIYHLYIERELDYTTGEGDSYIKTVYLLNSVHTSFEGGPFFMSKYTPRESILNVSIFLSNLCHLRITPRVC